MRSAAGGKIAHAHIHMSAHVAQAFYKGSEDVCVRTLKTSSVNGYIMFTGFFLLLAVDDITERLMLSSQAHSFEHRIRIIIEQLIIQRYSSKG